MYLQNWCVKKQIDPLHNFCAHPNFFMVYYVLFYPCIGEQVAEQIHIYRVCYIRYWIDRIQTIIASVIPYSDR
jgi:hypothetical protein